MRFLSAAIICALSISITGCGGGTSSTIPSPAGITNSAAIVQGNSGSSLARTASAAGAISYSSLVTTANPIAYYRLNDTTTAMVDSSANNLVGSYGANVKHGGTALTSSAGSQSTIFPGAAAGSDIPSNTATTPTNALFATAASNLTVEAWIKPAALNRTGTYLPLVSYGREIQGQAWVFQESPQSALTFYMKVTGGAAPSYLLNTGIALNPGQIYHIVAAYNGSSITVYVNGQPVKSMPATGAINYSGLASNWGLAIGGAEGSSEPIFNGSISDVSIYATALAAAYVAQHYATGTIPTATPAPSPAPSATASAYGSLITSSSPLAFFRLNDTGSVMTDSGVNKLNGVYGVYVQHGASPMTSAGENAALFPGSSATANIPDYTGTLPANAIFNTASTGLTVEAWIKLTDYNRTNTTATVLSYGRSGIGNVWAFQITPQTTLAFYLKVNGGPGSYLVKSSPLLPAQTYHVVATYDGANAKVFINGALATSLPATGTLNYSGFAPQYGLTIGGGVGGSTPAFAGAINDVSIYATPLSPAAVNTHYLTGQLIKPLVETPASSDSFVDSIGVVTHLRATGPYTNSFPTFLTLLKNSGIRHIGDALTTDPSWYVQEIQQLAANGIHASLITDATQTPQVLTATFPAFAGAIEAVEGLNEPDITGDTNWVADTRSFQQMLYSTVKGNPSTATLPVVGPSMTTRNNDIALGDLSAYMDNGSMHDYFDGYNPGTPGWGSLSQYGVYGALSYNLNIASIVSGTKPMLSTETGYGNAPTDMGGVDNTTLARYIPRLYLEHFLAGVKRTTIYEFYDEAGGGNFDDFGLVGLDNTPKSSYLALKSLIGTLADPGSTFTPNPLSYILSGNLNNVNHLLLQKRDGTYEFVVWVETPSYNPTSKTDIPVAAQTVTLTPSFTPASASISTIGDSGNSTANSLTFTSGTATFTIDDHVTIVSFK